MSKFKKKLFSSVEKGQQMSKKLTLLFSLITIRNLAFAQGTIVGATQLQNTIIEIVNIIFVIVIVLGLIRVIAKVVKGEPDWGGAVLGLVVALILWGGFNTYKNDIFAFFGGQQILNPYN